MKLSVTLALLLFALTPAAHAGDYELLDFLTGCWSTDGSFESWGEASGNVMLGMSKNVRKGATRSFEFMRIEKVEGGVIYVPYPGGVEAAAFRLQAVSASSAVFVNPENDFPSSIRYEIVDGKLQISLGGDEQRLRYALERVDCVE